MLGLRVLSGGGIISRSESYTRARGQTNVRVCTMPSTKRAAGGKREISEVSVFLARGPERFSHLPTTIHCLEFPPTHFIVLPWTPPHLPDQPSTQDPKRIPTCRNRHELNNHHQHDHNQHLASNARAMSHISNNASAPTDATARSRSPLGRRGVRGWVKEAAKDARRRPTTWRGIRVGIRVGGGVVLGEVCMGRAGVLSFTISRTGWDGDGRIGARLQR